MRQIENVSLHITYNKTFEKRLIAKFKNIILGRLF